MVRMASFFGDRRGIAAIDYAFVAGLALTVRDLATNYGDVASRLIKHTLGIA